MTKQTKKRTKKAAEKRGYRDYTTERKGKLYGQYFIPLGNGKYKPVIKRMPNKRAAREWALEELAKLDLGTAPGETIAPAEPTTDVSEKPGRLTFKVYSEIYSEKYYTKTTYQDGAKVKGLRGYKVYKAILRGLVAYFGLYRLNDLTPDVIETYKFKRLDAGRKISTINRELALMRTILRKAKSRNLMTVPDPFELDDKLINTALEVPNNKKMTDRKAARLLARSRKSHNPLLHYLILTARHTGGRPSEIFPWGAVRNDGILREPLIWKNILDFDFQAVLLVSYKGTVRRERLVPASIELERGLRALYKKTPLAKPEDLLFPFASVKNSWKKLCTSARIDDVVFRDFRAYFNQELLDNGYDEVSRMLIMGHKSIQMSRHYAQMTPNFVKNFREKRQSKTYHIPAQAIEVSAAVN